LKSSYSNCRENGLSKSLNEEDFIEAFLFCIVTAFTEGKFSSSFLPLLPFSFLPSSPRKKRKRKNQRKRE
jgi:hypothetical protein